MLGGGVLEERCYSPQPDRPTLTLTQLARIPPVSLRLASERLEQGVLPALGIREIYARDRDHPPAGLRRETLLVKRHRVAVREEALDEPVRIVRVEQEPVSHDNVLEQRTRQHRRLSREPVE